MSEKTIAAIVGFGTVGLVAVVYLALFVKCRFDISVYRKQHQIAVPPGATIEEQLNLQNINKKEFAALMEMSTNQVLLLFSGEMPITQDIADQLEAVLGPPATFWLRLEARYRAKLAENTAKKN